MRRGNRQSAVGNRNRTGSDTWTDTSPRGTGGAVVPLVGAVMSGGRSSRFGRDKALLEIDGETLLQRTVRTVRTVADRVFVLGPPERAEQVESVTVLQDEVPGIGPIGGIYTALHASPGSAILAVAVDMPFLNAKLLRFMAGLANEADVLLPVVEGRGQQLHAIYGPACLPAIERQIAAGDYKIDRFFGEVRLRRLDEAELRRYDPRLDSFRNVNTPDAWAAVLRELGAGIRTKEEGGG